MISVMFPFHRGTSLECVYRVSLYRLVMDTCSNVAGFTPQYKELGELYNRYQGQGFVILGTFLMVSLRLYPIKSRQQGPCNVAYITLLMGVLH